MSSKAPDHWPRKAELGSGRAGFLLAEVLVAMVVAGLFLGVLSRAFSMAWSAARTPMDIMSAATVARTVSAAAGNSGIGPSGTMDGFSFERTFSAAALVPRPSGLAPAPIAPASSSQASDANPAGSGSKRINPGPAAPPLRLRRTTILVRAPSGRRVTFETVGLDAAQD